MGRVNGKIKIQNQISNPVKMNIQTLKKTILKNSVEGLSKIKKNNNNIL